MVTATKCCDKCGIEHSLKEIHIVWVRKNCSHSWLCDNCWLVVE
jgi:transposase